eukprot:PhF_6_TR26411/c0_g1_i3/m.38184
MEGTYPKHYLTSIVISLQLLLVVVVGLTIGLSMYDFNPTPTPLSSFPFDSNDAITDWTFQLNLTVAGYGPTNTSMLRETIYSILRTYADGDEYFYLDTVLESRPFDVYYWEITNASTLTQPGKTKVSLKVRDWQGGPAAGKPEMSLKAAPINLTNFDPMLTITAPTPTLQQKTENAIQCSSQSSRYVAQALQLPYGGRKITLNQVSDLNPWFGGADVASFIRTQENQTVIAHKMGSGIEWSYKCQFGMHNEAAKCKMAVTTSVVKGVMTNQFSLRVRRSDIKWSTKVQLALVRAQKVMEKLNGFSSVLGANDCK